MFNRHQQPMVVGIDQADRAVCTGRFTRQSLQCQAIAGSACAISRLGSTKQLSSATRILVEHIHAASPRLLRRSRNVIEVVVCEASFFYPRNRNTGWFILHGDSAPPVASRAHHSSSERFTEQVLIYPLLVQWMGSSAIRESELQVA